MPGTESLSAELHRNLSCLVDLNFASPRESSPGRAPWLLRKEGTARGQLGPARVVRFQEHDGGAKKLKCGGFKRRPFSTWQTQAPQRRATSAPGLRHVRTMLDDPPVRHLRPHNRVRDAGARSRAGRAAGAQTGAGGRAHRPIDRGHCLARRPSAVLAAAVRERVDGPSPARRRGRRGRPKPLCGRGDAAGERPGVLPDASGRRGGRTRSFLKSGHAG